MLAGMHQPRILVEIMSTVMQTPSLKAKSLHSFKEGLLIKNGPIDFAQSWV
jgi:hypothetical protein